MQPFADQPPHSPVLIISKSPRVSKGASLIIVIYNYLAKQKKQLVGKSHCSSSGFVLPRSNEALSQQNQNSISQNSYNVIEVRFYHDPEKTKARFDERGFLASFPGEACAERGVLERHTGFEPM